ncbi:MAG: hypothetical protein R3Y22_04570 [Bacteroidales bacterium]
MLEINYKSDFAVIINFINGDELIGYPEYDFELTFSTGSGRNYIISKKDDELLNCIVSDDELKGLFIAHNMGKGVIVCNQVLFYPNEDYPDGIQRIESIFNSGVQLIDGIGNELSMTTISGILPTADYNTLTNKPQINGVELEGDLSGDDIKLNLSFVSINE